MDDNAEDIEDQHEEAEEQANQKRIDDLTDALKNASKSTEANNTARQAVADELKKTWAASNQSYAKASGQIVESLKKFPEEIQPVVDILTGKDKDAIVRLGIGQMRAFNANGGHTHTNKETKEIEALVGAVQSIDATNKEQFKYQKEKDQKAKQESVKGKSEPKSQTKKTETPPAKTETPKTKQAKTETPKAKQTEREFIVDQKGEAEDSLGAKFREMPKQTNNTPVGDPSTNRYFKPNHNAENEWEVNNGHTHSGKTKKEASDTPETQQMAENDRKLKQSVKDAEDNLEKLKLEAAENVAQFREDEVRDKLETQHDIDTRPERFAKMDAEKAEQERQINERKEKAHKEYVEGKERAIKKFAKEHNLDPETVREQLDKSENEVKDKKRPIANNPLAAKVVRDWERGYKKDHPKPDISGLYERAGINYPAKANAKIGPMTAEGRRTKNMPTLGELESQYWVSGEIPEGLRQAVEKRFGKDIWNKRLGLDEGYIYTDVGKAAQYYRQQRINKFKNADTEALNDWNKKFEQAKQAAFNPENVQVNTSNVTINSPKAPEDKEKGGNKQKAETPKSENAPKQKTEKETPHIAEEKVKTNTQATAPETPKTEETPKSRGEESMRSFLNEEASFTPDEAMYEGSKEHIDKATAEEFKKATQQQKWDNRPGMLKQYQSIGENRDLHNILRELDNDRLREEIANRPVKEAEERAEEAKRKLIRGHNSRGGGIADSLMYGLMWRIMRMAEIRGGLGGSFAKDMLGDALTGELLRRLFGYTRKTTAKKVVDEQGNPVVDENGEQKIEEDIQLDSVKQPKKWQVKLRKLIGLKPNATPQERRVALANLEYRLTGGLDKLRMVATPVLIGAAALGGTTAWLRDIRNRTLNNGTDYITAGTNTIQDALFDALHLFGFAANSGEDIRNDRQEALANNWDINSNRADTYVGTSMWARSMGLTTSAEQEYIREQTALGESAEQIKQSFLSLKAESQKLGVSFKTLTQMTAEQVTEADKLLGNQDQSSIIKNAGKFDALLNANGFSSKAAQDIANMGSFREMETQALADAGYAQQASYAGGNASSLLALSEKYGTLTQAFQNWQKIWYNASSQNEIAYSTNMLKAGLTGQDVKSSFNTSFTNTQEGLTPKQEINQVLKIQLDPGLSGQIQNQNLYTEGLHSVGNTDRYFEMNNHLGEYAH